MTRRERRSLRELRRSVRAGLLPRARPDRVLRARLMLRRWGPTPAGACRAAAISDPDRVAIADDYGTKTFAEVDERTGALAASLHARGYRSGDTVAVMCANHHWLVETHIAASKLGMNILYLDVDGDTGELGSVLRRHGARLLVYDADRVQELRDIPEDCGRLRAAGTGRDETLDQLIAGAGPGGGVLPCLASGTVTLAARGPGGSSRRQAVAATLLRPGTMSRAIPLRARRSTLICAPLSSPWGHLHLTLALRLSSTLVLSGRFEALDALAALELHQADAIVFDDEMLQAIMSLPRETLTWYDLRSLRVIAVRERHLAAEIAIPAISRFHAALYSRTGPAIVRLPGATAIGEVPAAA